MSEISISGVPRDALPEVELMTEAATAGQTKVVVNEFEFELSNY